jgi:2-iminobutanoate/2-iminopropanoate deaminase
MSEKEAIEVPDGPKPVGPYSPAIRVGDHVYLSGNGAIDPSTGKFVGEGDIKVQTKRVLDNMQLVVQAAGLSMEDVVKCTVFLRKASDFQAMNEVYRTFFPQKPPARSTVVTDLLFPEMLVEIEGVAFGKPADQGRSFGRRRGH